MKPGLLIWSWGRSHHKSTNWNLLLKIACSQHQNRYYGKCCTEMPRRIRHIARKVDMSLFENLFNGCSIFMTRLLAHLLLKSDKVLAERVCNIPMWKKCMKPRPKPKLVTENDMKPKPNLKLALFNNDLMKPKLKPEVSSSPTLMHIQYPLYQGWRVIV